MLSGGRLAKNFQVKAALKQKERKTLSLFDQLDPSGVAGFHVVTCQMCVCVRVILTRHLTTQHSKLVVLIGVGLQVVGTGQPLGGI